MPNAANNMHLPHQIVVFDSLSAGEHFVEQSDGDGVQLHQPVDFLSVHSMMAAYVNHAV
jgi:hypothetical protein